MGEAAAEPAKRDPSALCAGSSDREEADVADVSRQCGRRRSEPHGRSSTIMSPERGQAIDGSPSGQYGPRRRPGREIRRRDQARTTPWHNRSICARPALAAAAQVSRAWPFEEARRLDQAAGRPEGRRRQARDLRDRLRSVRPAAHRHLRRGGAHEPWCAMPSRC